MKQQLGDRMKQNYEKVWNFRLPARMPIIIRLDGKSFHTFTKDMERPYDHCFVDSMNNLARHLCKEISCTQLAYVQSDEISLLLHPYKKLDSQGWFNNEIQKMTSVSAGIASSFFSRYWNREAIFDSRVFVLPEAEVVNYFIWRQQDATRNSINLLAQSLYTHDELLRHSTDQLQELTFRKGKNWNDVPTHLKRGFAIRRIDEEWRADTEIPIFSEDRQYIGDLLVAQE